MTLEEEAFWAGYHSAHLSADEAWRAYRKTHPEPPPPLGYQENIDDWRARHAG